MDQTSRHEQEHERHHWHDETPEWFKHEVVALRKHLDRELRRQAVALKRLTDYLLPGPAVSGTLMFTDSEGVQVADLQIQDTDTAAKTVTASFKDAAGQAAVLNDVPAWKSSDESVATVDASGDPAGLVAQVTPLGIEGATSITADTIDADGTDVQVQGTLTVVGGAAVVGELNWS